MHTYSMFQAYLFTVDYSFILSQIMSILFFWKWGICTVLATPIYCWEGVL